jgi:16S rRNA U1498 N3-methylase RsmE
MTDRFEPSARAMAELNGLPDYPYVVIPHPVANDSDETLRQMAEAGVDRLVSLVTRRDPRS